MTSKDDGDGHVLYSFVLCRCLPLARQIDEAWLLGEALLEAGSIALELGKTVEATRFLEAASDTAQQTWPAGLAMSQALLALALAHGEPGSAREALTLARKGVTQVRTPDDRLSGSVAILATEVALNGDALADLRARPALGPGQRAPGGLLAECAATRKSARLAERPAPRRHRVSSLQAGPGGVPLARSRPTNGYHAAPRAPPDV